MCEFTRNICKELHLKRVQFFSINEEYLIIQLVDQMLKSAKTELTLALQNIGYTDDDLGEETAARITNQNIAATSLVYDALIMFRRIRTRHNKMLISMLKDEDTKKCLEFLEKAKEHTDKYHAYFDEKADTSDDPFWMESYTVIREGYQYSSYLIGKVINVISCKTLEELL